MTPGEPKARGLSFSHWLASFSRLYGDDSRAGLIERVAGELAAVLRRGFEGQEWYPLRCYSEMLAAARDLTGDGDEMIERVARISAKSEFTGVHRVLLLFVSPHGLMRMSNRVFHRYYTHGVVETIPRGRTAADVRWSGCRGFDGNVWRDAFVATTVAVEMCGGKDVAFRITDGCADMDHATVHFEWS